MYDKETIEVYNNKVTDYMQLVDRPPSDFLIDFIKRVKSNGTVLDLGCGPGNAVAEMKRWGLNPYAIDASSEMIKTVKKLYDIDAKVMTFNELDDINIYDGVYASFSLLHEKKRYFKSRLSAIYKSMKKGAIFSLGMKLGKGQGRDSLGRFYAYYSEDELLRIVKKSGFNEKMRFYGKGKGLVGNPETWIVLQLEKCIKK